jgi:hypothetical protein
MSSLSEQDQLNPNDPAYYAPRWLRGRSKSRSSPSHEARSEPVRAPISPPASLDIQLENMVSDAVPHPLGPEVIHEPAGLAREDRRAALFSVGALIVGVSAVVALFFVIMVPASQGSKPALAEFEAALASAPAGQNATHEQSEQLLQQFLQWRQKTNSTETSQ